MKTIKLYFRFLAVHLKTAMAYKGSFILSCIGQLFITTNVFLGVKFLLDRFGSVGGYRLPELTLCYSVILLSCSLAECFGRGFDAFPRILSGAQFDRILVRPRGIIFQILCQDMKPSVISRAAQGVVMLVYGITAGAVHWTIGKALTLAAMVLCGSVLFFGLFLLYAALCFFTMEGLEVMNIFTDGAREYGKYPFGIYGKGVLWITTLIVPLALVQYWPLQYLLDRGPWQYGLLPMLSLLFLIPVCAFWKFGVAHYRSTGS